MEGCQCPTVSQTHVRSFSSVLPKEATSLDLCGIRFLCLVLKRTDEPNIGEHAVKTSCTVFKHDSSKSSLFLVNRAPRGLKKTKNASRSLSASVTTWALLTNRANFVRPSATSVSAKTEVGSVRKRHAVSVFFVRLYSRWVFRSTEAR